MILYGRDPLVPEVIFTPTLDEVEHRASDAYPERITVQLGPQYTLEFHRIEDITKLTSVLMSAEIKLTAAREDWRSANGDQTA